jgi:hypothetical protein
MSLEANGFFTKALPKKTLMVQLARGANGGPPAAAVEPVVAGKTGF